MEKKEIYWYEERCSQTLIVGIRGGAEYRLNRFDWERYCWKNGILNAPLNIQLQHIIKFAKIESEYIDFEPVVAGLLNP